MWFWSEVSFEFCFLKQNNRTKLKFENNIRSFWIICRTWDGRFGCHVITTGNVHFLPANCHLLAGEHFLTRVMAGSRKNALTVFCEDETRSICGEFKKRNPQRFRRSSVKRRRDSVWTSLDQHPRCTQREDGAWRKEERVYSSSASPHLPAGSSPFFLCGASFCPRSHGCQGKSSLCCLSSHLPLAASSNRLPFSQDCFTFTLYFSTASHFSAFSALSLSPSAFLFCDWCTASWAPHHH